jgi:hypothetical protein
MNQLLLTLILLSSNSALGQLSKDFDYDNNREFLRKYPDMACIDTGPLGESDLASLSAEKIQEFGQSPRLNVQRPRCRWDGRGEGAISESISGGEYLDRLYARLTSGPIPHGFFEGKVVLPRDNGLIALKEMGIPVPSEGGVERFAQRMWSGKFFDNKIGFLKNRINFSGVATSPPTSLSDRRMKFPAKLYCGQSLFDSRRESIIIDYKFGIQDIPDDIGSDKGVDWLAGKKGLDIRDEVRMVKPGLYLGRAYMHRFFGLYFILEYVPGTGDDNSINGKDACWIGHQRQRQLGLSRTVYGNGG